MDEDEKDNNLDLEDRLLKIASVNDRVSYMDKLEGLNKDFQTKVKKKNSCSNFKQHSDKYCIQYMTLSTNGGQMVSAPFDEDFDLPLDDDTKIF